MDSRVAQEAESTRCGDELDLIEGSRFPVGLRDSGAIDREWGLRNSRWEGMLLIIPTDWLIFLSRVKLNIHFILMVDG